MDQDKRTNEYNQMKLYCEKMKRKVAYIEGKYLTLKENRALTQQSDFACPN